MRLAEEAGGVPGALKGALRASITSIAHRRLEMQGLRLHPDLARQETPEPGARALGCEVLP